ncbi:uncharacterized protein J3D65DRAFT_607242 [Phyllosticta citribraziliensis]|uniref:Uncharacterized protein n=1 Tax=Phyllosticta citribraziliensis TaxID=989973 RepID=A0ABR1L912_9PEZI
MVSSTPMLCPLFKRWAPAFFTKASKASSRKRPHSLIEAEEGRHRKSSGSFAGRSALSHKIRINTSSRSLPISSVHLNIHLPHPQLRTPRLRLGQQGRSHRPDPPPHIFSSGKLPESSLFHHPGPRPASIRPQPRAAAPRRESLSRVMPQARPKTTRTRSLFESPTSELSDSSIFPYGVSRSMPVPEATEAEEDWLTAYAFAVTTPTGPTLTPLAEAAETTPRSSTTQSTRCPSAKISSMVRSKSKSRHDMEEDDENEVRGEWREEMDKERTATNARARRVMGERGSNDTGPPGRQWRDEWWGMLGWRHGASNSTMSNYSGEPKVVAKAKDDDVVSVVDYAMSSDKGGAVVGPFNPTRRFSTTSAVNNGGGGKKSCKAKEQDDRRRKTVDGRVGAAPDDHHDSSTTPTTTTTTATATSSSPSPASTARDTSPSAPVPHRPSHASATDFGLECGGILHSSASAPSIPKSPSAPKHATSRRRRSDSDNNGLFETSGHFQHRDASPIGLPASPTPVSDVSGKTWWMGGSGGGGITKTVDWSVRRGSGASSAGKQVRHQEIMRSGGSDWELGGGGGGGGTNSASASASGPCGEYAGASDSYGDAADHAAASASATASPTTATRWGLGWMRRDRSGRGGGLTDSLE